MHFRATVLRLSACGKAIWLLLNLTFATLLETNPDYVPGYQMYAQMLAQNHRPADAKSALTKGIASAIRQGNQHARSEMEALLSELG